MLKKLLKRNVDTTDRKVAEDLADLPNGGKAGETEKSAELDDGETTREPTDESGPDLPTEPEYAEDPVAPDTPDGTGAAAETMGGETGEGGDSETGEGEGGECGEVDVASVFTPELLQRLDEMEGDERKYGEQGMEILKSIIAATPGNPIGYRELEVVMHGLDYESAVAKAYAEGETAGRNARIEELISEGEYKGDGVGRLDGKPDSWSATPFGSIFDLALSTR